MVCCDYRFGCYCCSAAFIVLLMGYPVLPNAKFLLLWPLLDEGIACYTALYATI